MSKFSWTSSDKISGSAHDKAIITTSHEMFCCFITCIFLTNVLQNLRNRITAKLLDGGTKHGPSLSQPAHNVEQPSARQGNAIQMF